MQLWILFTQSRQFQTRPSELVGINSETDPYTAYCFDEACFMWGRHVDGELRSSQKGAKSDKAAAMKVEMRFRTLMREPEEDGGVEDEHKDFPKHLKRTPAPTRFRDPLTALKKK
jgi:hypothetical protein